MVRLMCLMCLCMSCWVLSCDLFCGFCGFGVLGARVCLRAWALVSVSALVEGGSWFLCPVPLVSSCECFMHKLCYA